MKLLEKLRDGLNYFRFEEDWQKLYEKSKKKDDDYAYWDVYVAEWDTFVKYPSESK